MVFVFSQTGEVVPNFYKEASLSQFWLNEADDSSLSQHQNTT